MSVAAPEEARPFAGWDRYPLNLEGISPEINLDLCHRLLRRESQKLFNPCLIDIRIETIPLSGHRSDGTTRPMTDRVTSEDQLEETLAVRINSN